MPFTGVNGDREPLNGVEEVKGFSFSGISTFKSCPKAFEFRYIKRLPESFNSIEAYMGSCVHEVLEWAYKERTEETEPSIQAALEQYSQRWQSGDFETIKIVKQDKSREDYYIAGREFLVDFFNRVFPHDASSTLYLEQKFEIPMTVAGGEIVYRGIIDRISKETDGTIRVTDYKTGKVGHPLDTLQLPSYAIYIFLNNIDQEIELCYEDLRARRTVVARIDRKGAKKIKEALHREIETIRSAKPEDFVAKPSILCHWCGYNHICPAARQAETAPEPVNTVPSSPTETIPQAADTASVPQTEGEYQEACPQCGSPLRERSSKYGPFLGCTNYPECRYTRDLGKSQGNIASDPDVKGEEICPECGSLLKKRKGRYGEFMGCTGYPQCRFTRQIG